MADTERRRNEADFTSTLDALEDIDIRRKAIEAEFGVQKQLRFELNYDTHEGGVLNWKGRVWMLDGRRELVSITGTSAESVVNRMFKEAYTTLRKEKAA